MKKFSLLITALTLAFVGNSLATPPHPQFDAMLYVLADSIPKDSTTKKERSFKVTIGIGDDDSTKTRRVVRTRFLMLDYGISTYLHKGKADLPLEYAPLEQRLLGSSNWNFHLIQQRVNLYKGNVSLIYGLSFEFNKYRFSNDYTLLPEKETVTFQDNPNMDFKRNQLNTSYLTVPMMLRFRIRPKQNTRAFHLAVGGYAGMMLNARTKQRSGELGRVKVNDDFNMNKVRYGLTARAGYGFFNVYVNHGLSSFFDKDETGDFDLTPFNIGIAILPF